VAAENDALSASGPSVVRSSGIRLFPWLAVVLMLVAAGGSGYLGARLGGDVLRPELALRPPVIVFDMATAVRGVEAAQLAAVVARETEQAKRLAAGGFLVLDAQAVIAAPPDLYLAPTAIPDGAGDASQ
jgi:hypothetical protein